MRGIILLPLLLSGCAASPTFHHWHKPGLAEHRQEMNADWYACVNENSGGRPPADMTARELRSADAMAVQCMKARGYDLAWSDNDDRDGLPNSQPQ